jgi:transcriptional regulator with XRE-family HTH domain
MTDHPENPSDPAAPVQSSLLPPADLRVRVRPAELARIVGVSRQAVSRWIKRGWVTTFPDGTVNPREAVASVIRHSHGRIRAKLLRPLTDDVDSLRRQLREQTERAEAAERQAHELEADLAEARRLESLFMRMLDEFDGLLTAHESRLRAAPDSTAWRTLLDELYEDAENLANMNDAPAGDDLDSLLAGIGEADDLVDAIDAMADADLAALFDELADAEDPTAPDALADGTGGGGGDA